MSFQQPSKVGSANAAGPTAGLKVCLGCREAKPFASFHRHQGSSDGYRPRCKDCRRLSSRAYYETNSDALKAKSARFRCDNPEQARASVAAWVFLNREQKLAGDREYYRDHIDEKRAYNKRPERRAAHRANARTQKAKRRAAITSTINPITSDEWQDLQDAYLSICVYCLETTEHLTMDHVVALNGGGDHAVGNVVPACRTCNRNKSDAPLVVFFARRPILA